MKIMMVHSHGVSTWAKIGESLIIWTYEDAVESSCQMDKPKWHLLHKHQFCLETWNNFGDQMDQLNDAKLGGERFYGYKNDLVIYQDF